MMMAAAAALLLLPQESLLLILTMVRRSSRTRQQPKSSYDEELKKLAAKKYSQDSDSELSDVEKEVNDAMQAEDEEHHSDMDDEDGSEDFSPKNKNNAKKVTPPPAAAAKKIKKAATVQVRAAASKRKHGTPSAKNTTTTTRSVQSALNALAKKVLEPSETPDNSLVAALLASYKPIPGMESTLPRHNNDWASHKPSRYTPQLDAIARHLLQQDSNAMHIELLNLLFRSVGGSVETCLPKTTDLEELDDNEWDNLVTNVVQVMRDSDTELLTAIPDDKQVGLREYRSIYQEFWYRLGVVILSHTPGTTATGNDHDDDDIPTVPSKSFSSSRFQVELMRELVSRVTELVLVGQPDLRMAATTAIWELAKASMERSVELTAKLETAQRQYAATPKGQSRKLQALQHSMDLWKRHKAELEVVVEEAVVQGVFIRRYRDSNAHIRRESLDTLRQLILLRPDIFLKDKYLKYLGWMASDKDAGVRLSALQGLLAPFKYKQDKRPASLQFALQDMQNVCTKFLPRIADCTDDSQSLQVQEVAMELVVKLMNEGFLDEWDDDDGWDHLNRKALDANTSQSVRKNALYLILDQLDSFDEGTDARSATSGSVVNLSERQQIVRIDAIARWIAHLLTNGPVATDKIKVELADHIVQSLRDMPEHKSLTTSWNAMLKAIRSENPQQGRQERQEVAKTAVLLRMLACAAKLEVGEATAEDDNGKKKKKESASSNQSKEALSQALLKSLPGLLSSFKTDRMSMRSLTKLPQYLQPEFYSLPTRKSDFTALVKNLCVAYLESSDEEILNEIATSLSLFVQGDHARVGDVKGQLRRVSTALQDGLMELFAESDPDKEPASPPNKKKRKSPRKKSSSGRRSEGSTQSSSLSEAVFSNSRETDVEHSICLYLSRWKILMQHIPVSFLFDTTDDEEENEVEGFFQTISEALGKRLLDRKPIMEEVDDDDKTEATRSLAVGSVWKGDDLAIHAEVANAVDVGLEVLLLIVAWNLHEIKEKKEENAQVGVVDDDENVHPEELLVVRLRDSLAKLIGLCYEQHLEDVPGLVYSEEHEQFSSSVQIAAGRVASDLRTLFPREWENAKDPTLRALALTDDFHLIGGFIRYLQSREDDFAGVDKDPKEATALTKQLLMPAARALTANWSHGNRKEAGIILAHLTGSGKLAASTVHAMARMMKKINPVRFLESQMASLRMAFKEWLDGEPELDSDRPTEEELQRYEQAVQEQDARLHAAEHLASRLSMTLGVGKLNDARLSQALANFMQEGIRYAFEGDATLQDNFVLGSPLPFLRILTKYANWMKKSKTHRATLVDFLMSKEASLRAHPEFDEVHEDDLQCITDFQEALGIKIQRRRRASQEPSPPHEDASVEKSTGRSAGTPGSGAASAGSRRALSVAGSHRSRVSVQSNLSPLLESPEDRDEDAADDVSPQKRRRLTKSLGDLNESRIDEEGSDSDASPF